MAIGWAHSDGTSGVYDNPSEAVMEQPIQVQARQSGADNSADVSNYDHPEADLTSRMQMQEKYLNYKKQPLQAPYKNLPEQEFKDLLWDTPIASSKGGGPSAPDIHDILNTTDEEHKANYDAAVKALGSAGSVIGGVQPAGRIRMRKDIEGFQEYIKDIPEGVSVHDLGDGTVILRKAPSKPPEVGSIDKPAWQSQLAAFQQRLDATPPAEASELQKFFGSLNIMPRPGKPQEEWTVKEHLGVMLNTAMAGMGGGYRMPKITGPGFGARPPATFDYPMDFKDYYPANNANRKGGVTFREGENLTTETIPQLQQAQDRRVNWPEGWGTKLPEGKRILSASDYPHIQKAFKEAVEQGKSTSPEVSDYILEKHGIDLSSYMVKRLQETSGVKLEDTTINATNSGWTPELISKLKEGFDKGKSFQTLAADLGQSRGQIAGKVSRLLKEGVLVERPTITSGVEANPEKMARFNELRSKGLSYREIADDLNITTSYARVIASRNKNLTTETIPQLQQAQDNRYNPSDLKQTLQRDKFLKENPQYRQVPFGFESEQISKLTHQEYLDMMAASERGKSYEFLATKGLHPNFNKKYPTK